MLRFRTLSKELYLKLGCLKLFEEGKLVVEKQHEGFSIEVIGVPGLTPEMTQSDTEFIRKEIQKEKQTKMADIDARKEGTQLAISDLNIHLEKVKGQIKTDNFNNLRYLIIKLPFLIDISFDTSFVPEIEEQSEVRKILEAFTGTTLFENNETFICFTWHKGQSFCQNFMKELENNENIKNYIYSFVFHDSRELIIRKFWWGSLDITKQNNIKSGTYSDYFGIWAEKDIEILKRF